MAGRLPYIKRIRYTHMVGDEVAIWSRFIEKFPGRFQTVDYDFRVGQGMEVAPDWPDNRKRDAKSLSQKRIDVIGWNKERPTIIEVKKRVGLSALGQILGYRQLFMEEFNKIQSPRVLIVTENIGIDDARILRAMKVPVEVV